MNESYKLPLGILIGLVVALGIGYVAFNAGKMSNELPLQPLNSTQPTSLTPIEDQTSSTPQATPAPAATTTQKVSGTFGMSDGLFADTLCFSNTNAVTGIPAKTFFCFNNQDIAKKALKVTGVGTIGQPGCDYISGKADITISDFTKPSMPGDSPNGAKFVSVNKITVPAQCGKGQIVY